MVSVHPLLLLPVAELCLQAVVRVGLSEAIGLILSVLLVGGVVHWMV